MKFWKGLFSASIIYGLLTILVLLLVALKNANADQYLDPQYTWSPRYYFFINLTNNETLEPIENANIHLTYDDRLFHTNENGTLYFEVPENITYYIIITKLDMNMKEIRDTPSVFYSTNFSPSFIYESNLSYHNYLMTTANKEEDLPEVAIDLIVKTIIGIGIAGGLTGVIILLSFFYNRT